MSTTSTFLSLPYLQSHQAQKHVTHNESIRMLDSIVQLDVISAAVSAPPPTPTAGDRYIVPHDATGDWADYLGQVAVWDENAWLYYPPLQGWLAFDGATAQALAFDGAGWVPVSQDLQNLGFVGINTTADGTNRLAVSADATLLTHDTSGDHRLKLNKAAATDTASLVFQTGWSGRAEMGTAGDDDFFIKTSADGGTFTTALLADHTTGQIDLPRGVTTSDATVTRVDTSTDASLSWDTGGLGYARLGLDAQNDLDLGVSMDGSSFQSALTVDTTTGVVDFPQGATGITDPEFGDETLLTADYMTAKGVDLVTNGTCILGNTYNFPDDFTFDGQTVLNLPGAASYGGHYPGVSQMKKFLPVDPNKIFRISSYIRQESVPGDWSAYNNADRQLQQMGLITYDVDKQLVMARHHMRYAHAGVDSRTTLSAPLTPGDTVISVTDAAGWNETMTSSSRRGVIIFGYKNSHGFLYSDYSRYCKFDLFDLGDVDKTAHQITLNQPLPPSLGNPDDPNGTRPAGTVIANSDNGDTYKYSGYVDFRVLQTDTWFSVRNYMGELDRSGPNVTHNFPPGIAFVRSFWLPNYSNRVGGWGAYPDRGTQRVWVAGISVALEAGAVSVAATAGHVDLYLPTPNFTTGQMDVVPAGLDVTEV